jgi:hypothetical protein
LSCFAIVVSSSKDRDSSTAIHLLGVITARMLDLTIEVWRTAA